MQIQINSASLDRGNLVLDVPVHESVKFLNDFKPGKYEMKKAYNKRSKNANDFCWAICDKIADVLRMTKEDVYRRAIRDVGVYKVFDPLPNDQAKTLQSAWEKLGVGWVTEIVDYAPDGDKVTVRAYYGSSTYNTKQMARLIDYLLQDAESVGLKEEFTDERIKSLLDDWEKQHGSK